MTDRICLYLTLPAYLAQWYAFECRQIEHREEDTISHAIYKPLEPVVIPRGSQESLILHNFLQKPPHNAIAEDDEPNIAIVIPQYRDKDPNTFNYLGRHGRQKLADTIRNRFCIELWENLHTFRNALSRQDNAIYAFMESNGIECSETNWNALAKIYQRQRSVYYMQKSRKKNSEKSNRNQ
ncbi:MAG: hypothetical protein IKN91_00110 [Paludibacteraceae bacterium]|nr:hypothetical protein [Paludibacteraceae bacterium]